MSLHRKCVRSFELGLLSDLNKRTIAFKFDFSVSCALMFNLQHA